MSWLIVERNLVRINFNAMSLFDDLHSLIDHRQIAQPEEVHFDQTHIGEVFHIELRDDCAVVVASVRGPDSSSGTSEMTTPAACMPKVLLTPSSLRARSITCLASSLVDRLS